MQNQTFLDLIKERKGSLDSSPVLRNCKLFLPPCHCHFFKYSKAKNGNNHKHGPKHTFNWNFSMVRA